MRFIKDILFIDIETTNQDIDRDPVLQLSAVLLDKDNLLEKDLFNTYIRNSLLAGTLKEHALYLSVPLETFQAAPKPSDVAKQFTARFRPDVTLAMANMGKLFTFRQFFKKQATSFPYEFAALDQWTLYYMYSMQRGLKKMPTIHTLGEQFKVYVDHPRNAYERVKAQVEIFKRIINP